MPDSVVIYHNPRCSKSRDTLALLQQKNLKIETVEYLKQPPTAETVLALANKLGCPVSEMLRKGDAAYKSIDSPPADNNDAALAELIAEHPALLQRPIVVKGDRAAIGRPPESVLTLLQP